MSATAARPGASTAVVQERIREARERREPVRVVGAGSWLDAGHPVPATRTLPLGELSGIVDYVPGDFTLTARAGTPLSEIARATAAERQWLALDPFGAPEGTLGATIATASAGPLSHGFGLPRDNVLGLEIVTGEGQVVRAGGRVVKNVAGFDLTRLFTGSWGSLGAITEVTVRLRARPEVEETFAIAVDERPDRLEAVARALREAPAAPYALELLNGALAARLGIGAGATILARIGGNAEAVRAQRDALARVGAMEQVPDDVWRALCASEPARAAVVRFSRLPSVLPSLWGEVRDAAAHLPNVLAHATMGRGVVRVILPTSDAREIERFADGAVWRAGTIIPERLPDALWRTHGPAARGGVRERLARRVKETFDPMDIMNPGILGEARS